VSGFPAMRGGRLGCRTGSSTGTSDAGASAGTYLVLAAPEPAGRPVLQAGLRRLVGEAATPRFTGIRAAVFDHRRVLGRDARGVPGRPGGAFVIVADTGPTAGTDPRLRPLAQTPAQTPAHAPQAASGAPVIEEPS